MGKDAFALLGPLLRMLEPETAHRLTVRALAAGMVPPPRRMPDDPALASHVWNRAFTNPVGLAAGFDKNAEVPDAMLARGFGFVEVGTVTRRPQSGNPRPRVFRLARDLGLINRLGFNNDGLEMVAARLARRRDRTRWPGPIGVNVGPNRDSVDPAAECAFMVQALASVADYLVVNISSPNTPGLRRLQLEDALRPLLTNVVQARDASGTDTPILVKIAPDLGEDELEAIADVALTCAINGVIATNSTTSRPSSLQSAHSGETGGLSGAPLFARSTAVLADVYRLTRGKLPLVGVGGIASGADAYAKITAGASLVQLYTALTYQGPALIERIKRDLVACLRADGFSSLSQAVGSRSASR